MPGFTTGPLIDTAEQSDNGTWNRVVLVDLVVSLGRRCQVVVATPVFMLSLSIVGSAVWLGSQDRGWVEADG